MWVDPPTAKKPNDVTVCVEEDAVQIFLTTVRRWVPAAGMPGTQLSCPERPEGGNVGSSNGPRCGPDRRNASRNRALTHGWESQLSLTGELTDASSVYAFWVLKHLVLEIQSYLKTANNGAFLSTGKTLTWRTSATQKCIAVSCECSKCFCCGRSFCCQRKSKKPVGKKSSYRFSLITSRGTFDWCNFRAYRSPYLGVKMPTYLMLTLLFCSYQIMFVFILWYPNGICGPYFCLTNR